MPMTTRFMPLCPALRNVLMALLLAGGALAFAGCGSLDRSIAFGPLSVADMKYAATMPADPAPPGGPRISLNSAQYIIPTFPVYLYVKEFSRMQEAYGLMRGQTLLLAAGESRRMLMDKTGQPVYGESTASLLLLGGIDTRTMHQLQGGPETKWRVRIFQIPILSGFFGPCFGYGDGYLKVFWIPFANKWDPFFRPARRTAPPPQSPNEIIPPMETAPANPPSPAGA
jgi:hypothetical protein